MRLNGTVLDGRMKRHAGELRDGWAAGGYGGIAARQRLAGVGSKLSKSGFFIPYLHAFGMTSGERSGGSRPRNGMRLSPLHANAFPGDATSPATIQPPTSWSPH